MRRKIEIVLGILFIILGLLYYSLCFAGDCVVIRDGSGKIVKDATFEIVSCHCGGPPYKVKAKFEASTKVDVVNNKGVIEVNVEKFKRGEK